MAHEPVPMTPARQRTPQLDSMRGEVQGTVWPSLYSPRQATLAALILQLDSTQWSDPAVILAGQFRQLLALAEHASLHSPAFRARLDAAGLQAAEIASPSGLARLPELTRQQLQSAGAGLACTVLPEGHTATRIAKTSGSTGMPVVTHKTDVSRIHYLATTIRYNLWHEDSFEGRLCIARVELDNLGIKSSWGDYIGKFFETGPSLRIDTRMDVGRQADMIADFDPTSLQSYPSQVVALMNEFDRRGIRLPSLKRIRTIGETVSDSLRESVQERLGAALFDCYSSVEIGYIALDCPTASGLYHIMSEGVLVEVVSETGEPCGEGEVGRILLTDLQNYATPLIRYDIGDYAEVGPPCPCGRGLPTLRRILGRTRNMITLPDGGRLWPATRVIQRGIRDIAPVSQFQLVQHRVDMIELRLVAETPLAALEEEQLEIFIQDALGHPFEIVITCYADGRLPTGPRDKFEEVVNLVARTREMPLHQVKGE